MYFAACIVLLLATSTTAQNPLEERMDRMEDQIAKISTSLQEILTKMTNDMNQRADASDKDISDLQITVSNLDASLTVAVNDLDTRVINLETSAENRTIAFATTSVVTPIEVFDPMVFPIVEVNLGDGYNSETGQFTVPPGGAGVYFVYFFTLVSPGEFAQFHIRRTGVILCSAYGDHEALDSGWAPASCGIVSN